VESPAEEPSKDGLHRIVAPMLGVFYRAPAPGATPFVDVGAHVEETTVVCLIEVMKMMNAVPAGIAGTIVEICAVNAEAVEYGATLFRVEPDA
jgi:acetyl-CoA carboxylase biotin carboxyl carrier protein